MVGPNLDELKHIQITLGHLSTEGINVNLWGDYLGNMLLLNEKCSFITLK